MRDNIVKNKSFKLAQVIVLLCLEIRLEKKEFVLSDQLLRSGTSVGANIREAEYAQSKKDFIYKFSIAQKEINESIYWMDLMFVGNLIDLKSLSLMREKAIELLKIITTIIKTSKSRYQGH